MSVCANCRVDTGECPTCRTFWVRVGGKRYGVMITRAATGPTDGIWALDDLPNVVMRGAQ